MPPDTTRKPAPSTPSDKTSLPKKAVAPELRDQIEQTAEFDPGITAALAKEVFQAPGVAMPPGIGDLFIGNRSAAQAGQCLDVILALPAAW